MGRASAENPAGKASNGPDWVGGHEKVKMDRCAAASSHRDNKFPFPPGWGTSWDQGWCSGPALLGNRTRWRTHVALEQHHACNPSCDMPTRGSDALHCSGGPAPRPTLSKSQVRMHNTSWMHMVGCGPRTRLPPGAAPSECVGRQAHAARRAKRVPSQSAAWFPRSLLARLPHALRRLTVLGLSLHSRPPIRRPAIQLGSTSTLRDESGRRALLGVQIGEVFSLGQSGLCPSC
jgi:hypothetical protein